jgi:hypothetical protein
MGLPPFPNIPTNTNRKRNTPLPNAVNVFNCQICDKGYPRQVDYENHLRSYDHNHRTRLADMKKITAGNDADNARPNRGPMDMRAMPSANNNNKNAGLGKGFTKIGGKTAGAGFKKVGMVAGGEAKKSDEGAKDGVKIGGKTEEALKEVKMEDDTDKVEATPPITTTIPVTDAIPEKQDQVKDTKEEDVVMAESEVVDYEMYDFTKPTGCDPATWIALKKAMETAKYDEDGWVILPGMT